MGNIISLFNDRECIEKPIFTLNIMLKMLTKVNNSYLKI